MLYTALKYFVFGFNAFALMLGVGFISVCALGLEKSNANTDGHTYFIVGIILGSFICMTALFGCYGVLGELLGLLLIYTFFMLMLLLIQFLQMTTFQPHSFHLDAKHHLEFTWNQMDTQPEHMQHFEHQFECCGLHNSRDYNYLRLAIPKSCYAHQDDSEAGNLYGDGCLTALEMFYAKTTTIDRTFNWILIGSEAISSLMTLVFCVMLFRHVQRRQVQAISGYVEPPPRPRHNHVSSRTNLLEEEN